MFYFPPMKMWALQEWCNINKYYAEIDGDNDCAALHDIRTGIYVGTIRLGAGNR